SPHLGLECLERSGVGALRGYVPLLESSTLAGGRGVEQGQASGETSVLDFERGFERGFGAGGPGVEKATGGLEGHVGVGPSVGGEHEQIPLDSQDDRCS